jgi:cytochrome c peroxidase
MLFSILFACSSLSDNSNQLEQQAAQELAEMQVLEQQHLSESQQEARDLSKSLFGFNPVASLDSNDATLEKISLGNQLYHDKRLSVNQTQSCASCHPVENWGVDGLRVSKGALGREVERNSPSTFNSWSHVAQFWDGRAPDLVEQAKGPILAAGEMGMPSESAVVKVLSLDKRYEIAFGKLYEDGLTFNNVADAIALYESTLVTSDRFDDWMRGDDVLSEQEARGLDSFVSSGCAGCHSGPLFGGRSFQKLGVVASYRPDGDETHVDLGRYGVTGQVSDQEVFKVPSLRNVGLTGPWFHDGRVETLEEAVRLMGRLQLGREFNDEQVSDLVAFLKVLDAQSKKEE